MPKQQRASLGFANWAGVSKRRREHRCSSALLVGSVFADFNAVQARSVQSGANVTIAYDAQNGIVLQNVALANLDSSDFFFV